MLQGDTRERDMSFLDYSFAADLSADGKLLLFDEEGEAGGANYTVYLRKSDHSPVVRLGEGNALALSPDGKWAVSILPLPNSPIRLLPTGTGEPRELALPGLSAEQAAAVRRQQADPLRGERARPRRAALRAGDRGRKAAARHAGRDLDGAAGLRRVARRKVRRRDRARAEGRRVPRGRRRGCGRSPASSPASSRCGSRRTGARSTSGSAGTCPRASRASTSSRGSATSSRTSSRRTRRASSGSRTSSSRRTAKGYAYCYARLLSDLFVVEGLK